MHEVRLAKEADATLDRLWRDGQTQLVERLEDAIDLIVEGDKLARQHRLSSSDVPGGLWLVAVRHQGRTWAVVWSEPRSGFAKVHAIAETDAF